MHTDIWHSGHTLGKERTIISWVKVCNTPLDWILEECYPEGFAWADPSKIHKSEVFQLLDHWRQHEKDGLTPLIWNRSCELFDDGEICSRMIGIKKQKEAHSSFASPDGSLPSSPDPYSDSDEKDSKEEDFRADLAKIPSSNSDNPESNSSSDPQSPSPLPQWSVSRILENIPSSIPNSLSHFCEFLTFLIYFISFTRLHSSITKAEHCQSTWLWPVSFYCPQLAWYVYTLSHRTRFIHSLIIISLHYRTIAGTICSARSKEMIVLTESWRCWDSINMPELYTTTQKEHPTH